MKNFILQLGLMYATKIYHKHTQLKPIEPKNFYDVVVKKIKVGTHIYDQIPDSFTQNMAKLIGKTIQVKQYKNFKNWFHDMDHEGYYWHRKWLKFK